jgi:DNA polymerase III delta prime subunit
MSNERKVMWVEEYSPKTIEECILPQALKDPFLAIIQSNKFPNLLLSGPSGVGKTTVAKALCNEVGASVYLINGSDEGRFLDTIRNDVSAFASTSSITNKQKVIIIDEADNTTTDVQLLLRAKIEEFQNNCRFIFTCNYKNKIIPALQSRCSNIEFSIKGPEKVRLAKQFLTRLSNILDENSITYERSVLIEVIQTYFPDWRRILNECELYSSGGSIDTGILVNLSDSSVKTLVSLLKNKEYEKLRKWVFSNSDLDMQSIMRRLYDNCDSIMSKDSIPPLVLLIAKYQETLNVVADKEIHLLAFFTELMCECNFN